VVEAARAIGPDPLLVITSEATKDAIAAEDITVAVQPEARGTGDAVASARASHEGFDGDVLVLSGDAPLLTRDLLESLVDEHRRSEAAATVLTFEPTRPLPYGRIVRDGEGNLTAIVEEGDATETEQAIRELNSSTYVFGGSELWQALDELKPDNVQGELYLTDTVRALVEAGKRVATYKADDPEAPVGINTRVELAAAAAVLRDRINERHMLAGTTIVDPQATWIDARPARRRSRAACRRDRRRDRRAGAGRPLLLPSPRNRVGSGSKGWHVRRAEEFADRRRDEGAAPFLHRRRRDRREDERGSRRDHG
jgi:bifunctional UDP-N-acetylglucosamine pyrophosphorylase/glucosamine-1-phosphate N-acetyltransferase